MSDDKELRKLAEAATPGPWVAQRASSRHVITAGSIIVATAAPQILGVERERNAAYIAAVNPDVVLCLLDVLDAAKKATDADRPASESGADWLALKAAITRAAAKVGDGKDETP